MSENLAWMILVTLTVLGGVFWLVTTSWFFRLARDARPHAQAHALDGGTLADFDDFPRKDAAGGNTGRLEVKGRPEELAALLASDLGRHGLNGLPIKILGADRSRVRFEILSAVHSLGQPGNNLGCCKPRAVEVEFLPGKGGGSTSLAEYRLEPGKGRGLLIAGGIISILGLVALVVGFWALSTFVVTDPRSGVRAQVVQMVQCVHFLWPPWLFGLRYKRANDAYRQALTTRIANLPYL